jgi:hypothetical protein
MGSTNSPAQMGTKRAPRVAFSLNIVPKWRARIDLARMMSQQLSTRFGHISLHPGYFFRASVLVVNLNLERVLVGVRENRYPGNTARFWEIAINPSRFPAPAKRFPDDEQERYAKDLLVISEEVHAVLTRTPGVAQLRWWFVGWDVGKPGVRRPRWSYLGSWIRPEFTMLRIRKSDS